MPENGSGAIPTAITFISPVATNTGSIDWSVSFGDDLDLFLKGDEMDKLEPLSKYLLTIAEEMNSPQAYPEDTGESVEEAERSLAVVRKVTEYIVGSAEGLSDRATARFAETA
jgi:hypothetical protein